jgi:hypothetical protein
MEPDMLPPGLQPISRQHPLDRLGRDRSHHLIAHELSGEFGAVPLAERATGVLRQLAGPPHQVQRHLRGKTSAADPVADDRPRQQGRRHGSDQPRSARRSDRPPTAGRSDPTAPHPRPAGRSGHDGPTLPRPSFAASPLRAPRAHHHSTPPLGHFAAPTSRHHPPGDLVTIRPLTAVSSTGEAILRTCTKEAVARGKVSRSLVGETRRLEPGWPRSRCPLSQKSSWSHPRLALVLLRTPASWFTVRLSRKAFGFLRQLPPGWLRRPAFGPSTLPPGSRSLAPGRYLWPGAPAP